MDLTRGEPSKWGLVKLVRPSRSETVRVDRARGVAPRSGVRVSVDRAVDVSRVLSCGEKGWWFQRRQFASW